LKVEPLVANRSRYEVTEDWSASWIWCEGEPHPRNFHVYARKAFKLASKPTAARIRITADSRYRLYVNGEYVGWGAANSITRRLTYDTYDITPFLNRGNNAIAVIAYHLGHPATNYVPRRAALICEADIELKSGTEKIVTDDSWKVLPAAAWTDAGGRVSRSLGYQQVYDASLDPEGWNEAKFNDSKWQTPHVLGTPPMAPFGRLTPRDIPRMVEQIVLPTEIVGIYDCPAMPADVTPPDVPRFIAHEELKPLEAGRVDKSERILAEGDDATMVRMPGESGVSIVLDFGRLVYGSLEIALSKCISGVLDVAYDEAIGQSGLRPDKGGIRYTDRIVIKKGKQTWSSFEPRSFRYVQLDFRDCPKPFALNHIFVRDAAFPIELVGDFESSDPTLNQVWRNGVESVRRVLMESYLDSPWRDRTPSFADTVAALKPAYYAFGEVPLLEERLRHIAGSQRRDGALLALHPGAENRVFADLAMLFVIAVWDNYACGGDKSLLADLYPTIDRWQNWISRFVDDDGLLNNVRADLLLDWGGVNRHGEMAGLSLLYLGALLAMVRIAETLGRSADAEEFGRLANTLRAAIARNFWSDSRGLYSDTRMYGKLDEHFSRQTNILASRFDVPDHYQKSSVLRQMLDERGLPQLNSPVFNAMLLETMCRAGYVEQVLDFVRRTWGRNGSGAPSGLPPVYQLQAYLLGAVPTGNPARLRFEPHVADLRWVEGVIPTPAGPVRVRWKSGMRGFSMDVDLPGGVTAEIVPPRHELVPHVTVDGAQTQGAVIELGPGIHNVSVTRAGRQRRRGGVEVEVVEAAAPTPIPPNRGDIETVQQMIQILTQMEKEQVYVIPDIGDEGEAPEAAVEEPRKKSRRRGRRGRGKHEEVVGETTAVDEGVEAEVEEPAGEPAEAVETSEEAGHEKRSRRRRRRGRGRGEAHGEPGAEAAEAPETVEAAEESVPEVVETTDEAAAEPVSGKRPRRRRRRGGRGHEQAPVEEATAETAVETPIEPETVVSEAEGSAEHPAKRSRRRRRRSGRGGEAHAAEPAQAEVAQEAPAPVAEAETAAEPTEKRSRSRRRRSSRGHAAESHAPEAQAEAPVAPEPVAAEPTQAEERPRRSRRRPARTEEAHVVAETPAPVVERAPEPEAAPEKPARRRTRRTAKPEEAPAAIEQAPAVSEPAPAEPARRRTRRAAKPEAAAEPAPQAEPESAPKPRRRRTRKPAEEPPAEG
jgi:hypothetical protein